MPVRVRPHARRRPVPKWARVSLPPPDRVLDDAIANIDDLVRRARRRQEQIDNETRRLEDILIEAPDRPASDREADRIRNIETRVEKLDDERSRLEDFEREMENKTEEIDAVTEEDAIWSNFRDVINKLRRPQK